MFDGFLVEALRGLDEEKVDPADDWGLAVKCAMREAADAIEELQKQLEHSISRRFTVIDATTGEYPNLWDIALHEEWAKNLIYCDMEGFAVDEDGTLWLMDECGNMAVCPEGRFKIVPEIPSRPRWIPVTERLPEKHTAVLAAGNGEVACGLFIGFAEPAHVASWDLDNVAAEPVTHWMDLPEPPKEEA